MRKVDPPTVALYNSRASKLDNGEYASGEEGNMGKCIDAPTDGSVRHTCISLRMRVIRRESSDLPPLPDLKQPARNKGGRVMEKRVEKEEMSGLIIVYN